MVWLWESDEEYADYVHPVHRSHRLAYVRHQTWFLLQAELHQAVTQLDEALRQLRSLVIDEALRDASRKSLDTPSMNQAARLAEEVVYNGDLLLFYHKRLALTDWVDDYLHAHELPTYWRAYAEQGCLLFEINRLVTSAGKLLDGYRQVSQDDQQFLDNIKLPPNLLVDFTLSRNLFSAGFDDMGLFAAARGLEGVLRAIARRRKLTYQVRSKDQGSGKEKPLSDADFHDLIEAFARIKLTNGTSLIDKQTKSLLEFARTVRNACAHPGDRPRENTALQQTEIIARAAQQLWAADKGSRLAKVELIKPW